MHTQSILAQPLCRFASQKTPVMATGCKQKNGSRVYVVVGGGIAGVSCAEELSILDPKSSIYLISSSPLIKAVTNFTKVSRALEQFDIKEKSGTYLTQACPNVTVLNTTLISLSPLSQTAQLTNDRQLKYNKLCVCTGGTPKVIAKNHPRVIGIRDTESVQEFQKRLGDAKRIVVVGNGGIATELVYEVSGCEVVWAIKDHSITYTFFDEGAATFFLPHLVGDSSADSATPGLEGKDQLLEIKPLKRAKYTVDKAPEIRSAPNTNSDSSSSAGSALGPDWHSDLQMSGKAFDGRHRHVHVEYQCEVLQLLSSGEFKAKQTSSTEFPQTVSPTNKRSTNSKERETTSSTCTSTQTSRTCEASLSTSKDCVEDSWPVYVELTNKKMYGCDFVVSATGVTPNTSCLNIVKEEYGDGGCELKLSDDSGIIVDSEMRSSLPGVYAAGDVCTVRWDEQPDMWFQMRLWTQARQMGAYAARCMVAHANCEPITPDFCFELFAHVTQFFGYKVVLLGKYNAQGLGKDYEILLRCTKGVEYVKVILHHGRMVGAILIGETDLEETFENLILNGMDLSRFGESLLDPNIDIEDYFD